MTPTRPPFSDAPAWVNRCAADVELQVAGRDAAVTFAVRSGGARVVVSCDRGRIALGSAAPEFELEATPDAWSRFSHPIRSPATTTSWRCGCASPAPPSRGTNAPTRSTPGSHTGYWRSAGSCGTARPSPPPTR
ncbi:hypothetical protein BJF90_08420 [Pseudonocardia sp. CNS-004]|nr:hypothetical protein BJF90_08420 [Pseudonocardia sp. CNS-004]